METVISGQKSHNGGADATTNSERVTTLLTTARDAAKKAIDQWRKGELLYGAWFGNEPRYNFDGGITEANAQWSSVRPKINNWESR